MSIQPAPVRYYIGHPWRIILVCLAIICEVIAALHVAVGLPLDFLPLGLALFMASFL
jgi:uncharacterized membrane protein YphA (DoxX/SURF4 family)